MRIDIGRLGLLLFGLLLLYISGIYLGSIFLYAYYLLLFYTLFDLSQLFLTFAGLKVYQEFSTNHPVKGEEFDYVFVLANEMLIPTPLVRIRFMELRPGESPLLPPMERVLGPGKKVRVSSRISCPYRGVYRVGAEGLEIGDLLGVLQLRRGLPGRTFYVLPRILEIERLFFSSHRNSLSAMHSKRGGQEDFALYQGARVYREGESVRHFDWKRFLSSGVPVLKEYGTTSEPGVTIYLDLRPVPEGRFLPAEVEDCVMEALLSIIAFFQRRRIPVELKAAGAEPWRRRVDREELFKELHSESAEILFDGTVPPTRLFAAESAVLQEEGRTVLFITHREDGGVLELIEQHSGEGLGLAALLVTSGLKRSLRSGLEAYVQELSYRGAMVKALGRPEEIRG